MGLFDKFKSEVRSSKSNQSLHNKSFTVLTTAPTLSTNKVGGSGSAGGSGTTTTGPGNVIGNPHIVPSLSVPNIPNHVRSNTSHSSFSEFSNLGSDSSCTSSESHNYSKKNFKTKVNSIDQINEFNDLTINEIDHLPSLETKVFPSGDMNNRGLSKSPKRKPPSDLPHFEAEDFLIASTNTATSTQPSSSSLKQSSSSSSDVKSTTPTKSSSPYQSKRIISPQNHPRTQTAKGKSPPIVSPPNTTRKISPISNLSPWKPTPDQSIAYQQDLYNSTPENEFDSESNSESSNPPLNQQYWDQWKNYAHQQQKFPGYNNFQHQMYYQMQHQNYYHQQQQQQQQQAHQYYNQHTQSPEEPDNSYYLNNYQHKYKNSGSSNELLAATRKSTIKSKRFSSAPSINQSINDNSKRITSLDSNFKPNVIRSNDQDDNEDDDLLDGDSAKPYNSSMANADSAPAYDMSDKCLNRHISDYSKFLFDDGEVDEEDEEEEILLTKKTQSPNPTSIKPPLLRSVSADSKASFNSIQSDNSQKFKVSSTQERVDRLQSLTSNKPRSKSPENKSRQGYQPQQQNYPPPMSTTNGNYRNSFIANNNMPMDLSTMNGGNSPYSNNMMNFSTEYAGGPYDPNNRRQSMTSGIRMRNQPPQLRDRRSMIQLGSPNLNFQSQSNIPRIHDGTINRKIDEFIDLRMIISSGNKSLVYRLKWVQMLISAVNYNLYSFINIKGEPVSNEFAEYNKNLFIKSAITHLFKLLKEDTGKKKFANIRKEVYYIYGCLLKHDYVSLFDEDFGINKDIELSIEMFEKCLELNPIDYKSLYKLGEIFEFEYPEEIDKALQYYKESAQFSYNRAIYRIALLYINCPELRSLKFIKYLTDLANIHIDDIEVKSDDEFEEVSDVIGLAAYELGKIYEGIYPGDLAIDDEFVQHALNIVPVNYAKSLTYYNKSAKLNCVFGLVKLGNIYEFGELNRQQNPNKSIQWYTKATTSPFIFKRHPDAMLGLSRWNLNGSGGSNRQITGPNPQAAVMWCERAVKEFESVDAMYFMGELSEMGFTTTNANMWYSKAYNLGHEEAGRKLGLQPQYNGEGYDDDDDEPELSENEEEVEEEEEGRGEVVQDEEHQINSTIIVH